MPGVRLENVWKVYRSGLLGSREVVAVRGISFAVEDGEVLALLGPSGCGKTSTMRMIAGLERITSGDIYIGDRRVNDLEPGKRNVSMAFESYALYPPLNVFDNIAFPLRSRGLPPATVEKEVRAMARLLALEDILHLRPHQLSGGQQQRVSLARALVRRADLYLLDEPLSQLEPSLRFYIRARVKELIKRRKATTLFVTHDQQEAVALADRIAVMRDGIIHQVGSAHELYNQPADLFVADFIGEPPMNQIPVRWHQGDGWAGLMAAEGELRIPLRGPSVHELSRTLEGRQLILGIRPQDIRIYLSAGVAGEDGWSSGEFRVGGVVQSNQWMGDERIVVATVGGVSLTLVAPASVSALPGSAVTIAVPAHRLHLFDVESQKALYHELPVDGLLAAPSEASHARS